MPADWLLATDDWRTEDALEETGVAAAVCNALRLPGLLTAALSQAFAAPIHVECVRQTECEHSTTSQLRRDVVLKCGSTLCVAASSFFPQTIVAAHPWLARLGNQALGEALVKRLPHQRQRFEFRQLDASRIFNGADTDTLRQTWVRRFRFTLETGELLVTEAFEPAALERLIKFTANSATA